MEYEHIDKVKEIAKILNGLSKQDVDAILKRVEYVIDCSALSTDKIEDWVIRNISDYDFVY